MLCYILEPLENKKQIISNQLKPKIVDLKTSKDIIEEKIVPNKISLNSEIVNNLEINNKISLNSNITSIGDPWFESTQILRELQEYLQYGETLIQNNAGHYSTRDRNSYFMNDFLYQWYTLKDLSDNIERLKRLPNPESLSERYNSKLRILTTNDKLFTFNSDLDNTFYTEDKLWKNIKNYAQTLIDENYINTINNKIYRLHTIGLGVKNLSYIWNFYNNFSNNKIKNSLLYKEHQKIFNKFNIDNIFSYLNQRKFWSKYNVDKLPLKSENESSTKTVEQKFSELWKMYSLINYDWVTLSFKNDLNNILNLNNLNFTPNYDSEDFKLVLTPEQINNINTFYDNNYENYKSQIISYDKYDTLKQRWDDVYEMFYNITGIISFSNNLINPSQNKLNELGNKYITELYEYLNSLNVDNFLNENYNFNVINNHLYQQRENAITEITTYINNTDWLSYYRDLQSSNSLKFRRELETYFNDKINNRYNNYPQLNRYDLLYIFPEYKRIHFILWNFNLNHQDWYYTWGDDLNKRPKNLFKLSNEDIKFYLKTQIYYDFYNKDISLLTTSWFYDHWKMKVNNILFESQPDNIKNFLQSKNVPENIYNDILKLYSNNTILDNILYNLKSRTTTYYNDESERLTIKEVMQIVENINNRDIQPFWNWVQTKRGYTSIIKGAFNKFIKNISDYASEKNWSNNETYNVSEEPEYQQYQTLLGKSQGHYSSLTLPEMEELIKLHIYFSYKPKKNIV